MKKTDHGSPKDAMHWSTRSLARHLSFYVILVSVVSQPAKIVLVALKQDESGAIPVLLGLSGVTAEMGTSFVCKVPYSGVSTLIFLPDRRQSHLPQRKLQCTKISSHFLPLTDWLQRFQTVNSDLATNGC